MLYSPLTRPDKAANKMSSDTARQRRHGSARLSSKEKRGKSSKTRTSSPFLPAPLSVVTEDMDITVRDMAAWINRPLQQRHSEALLKKGHVSRPMNSFMLYRSAYAERTKGWCAANNHQVVSSVCGASWPMEPQSVRDFYDHLSKIERLKHVEAFPEYKFQPAKPGQKRGQTQVSKVYGGTVDGPDGDWAESDGFHEPFPHGLPIVRLQHELGEYGSSAPSSFTSDATVTSCTSEAVQSLAAPFYAQHQMYDDIQSQWSNVTALHNLDPVSYPGHWSYPAYLSPPIQDIYQRHLLAPEDDDSDAVSSCLSFHEATGQSSAHLHVPSHDAVDPCLPQASLHSQSESFSCQEASFESDRLSRGVSQEVTQEYLEQYPNNSRSDEDHLNSLWSSDMDIGPFWNQVKTLNTPRRSSNLLSPYIN